MLKVPSLETNIGIEVYASKTRGIGGVIKCSPEDFIVEEILTNGSKASVKLEDNNNLVNSLTDRGRYLICVLIKRGWDTLLAIEEMSKIIGIDPGRIGFAGIKDANALTSQFISIGGVPISKIQHMNITGLLIKPLGFSNEEISPKKLFGNSFTIVVRSIKLEEKNIRKRIEKINGELADFGGIPNFFGHQRFGTIRPITHVVGKHVIKGDFEKAVITFLSYESPFESAKLREIRRELNESMDFKTSLKRFPKRLVYERLLLKHLSKNPHDYLGALHKLPLNLRKLFVQSYQAYLFNRFLSERIKRGIPLKEAQVGDYMMRLDSLGLPQGSFIMAENSNIAFLNEEIKRGKMVLTIPLVGLKQPLSGGLQGEVEREILEVEGIAIEDFQRTKVIGVNMMGGLRVALERAMNFEVNIVTGNAYSGKSVKFRFILHKGTYATILLREYIKPTTDRQLINSGF
ncbi:MAG: tRNA pseudouridine(13) synthase TruD [Candidatus Bathyarchaeia archaeon]